MAKGPGWPGWRADCIWNWLCGDLEGTHNRAGAPGGYACQQGGLSFVGLDNFHVLPEAPDSYYVAYRPTSLGHVCMQGKSMRLVAGNTGYGIYKNWPNEDILINVKSVPDLHRITTLQGTILGCAG